MQVNSSLEIGNLLFLQQSRQKYQDVLAKIASGKELNSASDNASNMMIADELRSYAETLSQSVSNSNDSIGMSKIADGAMSAQSKILDEMKVKSVSANSAIHNSYTRGMIKEELQGLSASYENIANTTSFNGKSLLRGFDGEFMVGGGELASLNVGDTSLSSVTATKFSSDKIFGLASDGTVSAKLKLQSGTTNVNLNEVKMGTAVGQGVGELAKEVNKYSDITGIKASYSNEVSSNAEVSANTLNGVQINGIAIGDMNVLNNDSDGTLVNSINAQKDKTGVIASMKEDGKVSLQSTDGRGMNIQGLDTIGIVSDHYSGSISLVNDGQKAINVQDLNGNIDFSSEKVNLKDSINNMDTQEDAGVVQNLVDNAISSLGSNRANVGSFHNQMVSQSENLANMYVNTKYSESQLRDTDIAKQLSELLKQANLTQADIINQQYINKYRSGIMALLN